MMYVCMVARQMNGTGCLLGSEPLSAGQQIPFLCFRLLNSVVCTASNCGTIDYRLDLVENIIPVTVYGHYLTTAVVYIVVT
jgi:hypothetical protein